MKTVVLILFPFCFVSAQAQNKRNVQTIVKQLGDKSHQQLVLSAMVDSAVAGMDSATAVSTFDQLQKQADDNSHLRVRLAMLQTQIIFQQMRRSWSWSKAPFIDSLFSKALKTSMETGDDLLIAEVCRKYALVGDLFGQIEKAIFYSFKSLDIQEKYGIETFPHLIDFYFTNADILYKAGEYGLCHRQLQKVIRLLKTQTLQSPVYYVYNTMGLACYKLNQFDSAIYWYRTALPFTIQQKDTVWQGIVTGNIGDVLFKEKKYDSAKYFLLQEYEIANHSTVEKKSACNSLLKVARILVVQSKPDSALLLIKQAAPVVFDYVEANNRNLYITKSEVYKAAGRSDSAAVYLALFQHLEDSVKEKQLFCRADVTRIRLNYENAQYVITQIQRERKHEREMQFIIWVAFAIALLIAFVFYRQRLILSNLEKKLLLQQKRTAEQAAAAAREQLSQFTDYIIEKNKLIESLQQQLQEQNQTVHEELVTQTILTDDDWTRFKGLFEKVYPSFFDTLQTNVPRITPAELRLAALMLLKLETKNMAAMLGVSVDSARKSKSRLRQRLNIDVQGDFKDYIQTIKDLL